MDIVSDAPELLYKAASLVPVAPNPLNRFPTEDCVVGPPDTISIPCPSEKLKVELAISARSSVCIKATPSAVFEFTILPRTSFPFCILQKLQSLNSTVAISTLTLFRRRLLAWTNCIPYRDTSSVLASEKSMFHRAPVEPACIFHPWDPVASLPVPLLTPARIKLAPVPITALNS